MALLDECGVGVDYCDRMARRVQLLRDRYVEELAGRGVSVSPQKRKNGDELGGVSGA